MSNLIKFPTAKVKDEQSDACLVELRQRVIGLLQEFSMQDIMLSLVAVSPTPEDTELILHGASKLMLDLCEE